MSLRPNMLSPNSHSFIIWKVPEATAEKGMEK